MTSKNITGGVMGTSGMGYGGDHGNMQPHYLGELSKTSRTLGADDLDNQVSMIRSNHGQMRSSQAARKVQRVHRRVKVRVIPYFQRKHRLGQRVSSKSIHLLIISFSIAHHPETVVKTNGGSASRCHQDPGPHQKVPLQEEEGDRPLDPILSRKATRIRQT
jgi:hypothetical protein|tara:strand:- start:1038 stop:1520 length:483 start_codon:yes stop_codon:yes gene_type:complete